MRCGTLASKFATPQSLVDFCKSSPEANKTDGDCDLDEIRRLGVKEGLQIDVVHQVGPDANNFSSLFSVRVVKRDSGVDLKFATHLAASPRSECQIQNSTSTLYLLVVL